MTSFTVTLCEPNGNEIKLNGSPDLTLEALKEYIKESLLKYTCFTLDPPNPTSLNTNINISNGKYTEALSREQLQKVSLSVFPQGILFKNAAGLSASASVQDCFSSPTSPLFQLIPSHSLDHFYSLKCHNHFITATPNGFLLNDTLYTDLCTLLSEAFDIKDFDTPISNPYIFPTPVCPSTPPPSFLKKAQLSNVGPQYQELIDASTTENALEMDRCIHQLHLSFKKQAIEGVYNILKGTWQPINPQDPIDKHIYIDNGLFYGLCADWYGHLNEDPVAIRAMAKKEVEAISIFNKSQSTCRTSLACVIDLSGKSFFIQSMNGASFKDMLDAPVVYGMHPEENTFVHDLDITPIAQACGYENPFTEHVRITQGKDGRLYASDLVRMTPIDTSANTPIAYYRPELVDNYKQFHTVDLHADTLGPFLLEVIVPLTSILLLVKSDVIITHSDFIEFIHLQGVNVRYIGKIYQCIAHIMATMDIQTVFEQVQEANKTHLNRSLDMELSIPPHAQVYERCEALLLLMKEEMMARCVKNQFYRAMATASYDSAHEVLQASMKHVETSSKFGIAVEGTVSYKRVSELVGLQWQPATFVPVVAMTTPHYTSLSSDEVQVMRDRAMYIFGEYSAEGLEMRRVALLHRMKPLVASKEQSKLMDLLQEAITIVHHTEMVTGALSGATCRALETLLNMAIHFYADLVPVVSAHLYRLSSMMTMPKFKVYAHLDILMMTSKEDLSGMGHEEAHYYQALANTCYRFKAYKDAYQHQKKATALFQESNPYMVEEANKLCHLFVQQAVNEAKESKS